MASGRYPTIQYTAENFVKSAGAILIKLSTQEIVLVKTDRGETLIPKGRRNVGESREAAALREVKEETGITCRLLPVTMMTRATPAIETTVFVKDIPRVYIGVCEPFMVTHRTFAQNHVKIIWWYIATVDEEAASAPGEEEFTTLFLSFDKAEKALTFENDREVLRKAIEIYKGSTVS